MPPSIRKIALRDPVVPIRGLFKAEALAISNSDGSIDLFNGTPFEVRPVTANFSTCALEVTVSGVDYEDNLQLRGEARTSSGKELTVSFSSSQNSSKQKNNVGETVYIVPAYVDGAPAAGASAPWAACGSYEWTYIPPSTNGGERISLGATPLEIYGVYPKQPACFTETQNLIGVGIPLDFLRLLVPPRPINEGINRRDKWIEWVTGVCHGSINPKTSEPQSTDKHWLKYDVEHGGNSFAQYNIGVNFKLDAWLQVWNEWQAAVDTRKIAKFANVNCYDQAGIAEIALALGINCDEIAWEYHQVYGYIQPAELVGWGLCNNPYFSWDKNWMMLKPADKLRSPFRNHAFISIGSPLDFKNDEKGDAIPVPVGTGGADKRLIVDACAGPHCGTETRDVYLGKAIDPDQSLKDELAIRFKDETTIHNCYPGITTIEAGKAPMTLVAAYQSVYSAHTNTLDAIQRCVDAQLNRLRCIHINDINKAFKNSVQEVVCATKPIFIDFEEQDIKPTMGLDWVETETKLWYNTDSTDTYMYLKVTEFKTNDKAFEGLKQRITLFTPAGLEGHFLLKGTQKDVDGKEFVIIGSDHLSIFVLNQLLVEVGSLKAWKKALDTVTDKVAGVVKMQALAS